jgi:hypothetical protein
LQKNHQSGERSRHQRSAEKGNARLWRLPGCDGVAMIDDHAQRHDADLAGVHEPLK